MTYNVLMGTLNPTHSLTHSLTHSRQNSGMVTRMGKGVFLGGQPCHHCTNASRGLSANHGAHGAPEPGPLRLEVLNGKWKSSFEVLWRHIHCFIPASKLTFSTNLFHHSLLAPTWSCLLGLYWTGLTLLNGFSFLVIFFLFYFGTRGRLSWLDCQLSSAR